jgi:hypothetical protein
MNAEGLRADHWVGSEAFVGIFELSLHLFRQISAAADVNCDSVASQVGGETIGFDSAVKGPSKIPTSGAAAVHVKARSDNVNRAMVVVVVISMFVTGRMSVRGVRGQ